MEPAIKSHTDVLTKSLTRSHSDVLTKSLTRSHSDVLTKPLTKSLTIPDDDVLSKLLIMSDNDVLTKPDNETLTTLTTAGELERGDRGGRGDQRNHVCHVNATLLPVKVFNFFYFGAVGAVIPFITVYLQHLQLTAPETGVITGVSVLLAMVLRPTLGVLADICSSRRPLLRVCCLLMGLGFASLWFVPSRQRLVETIAWFQCRPTYPEDCVTVIPEWSRTRPQCFLLAPTVHNTSFLSAYNNSQTLAVFTSVNNQTTRLDHGDDGSSFIQPVYQPTSLFPLTLRIQDHQKQSPHSQQRWTSLSLTCWLDGPDDGARDHVSYSTHVTAGNTPLTQAPVTNQDTNVFTGHTVSVFTTSSEHSSLLPSSSSSFPPLSFLSSPSSFPPPSPQFVPSSSPSFPPLSSSADGQPYAQHFSERQCNFSCVPFHPPPPPPSSAYTLDLTFCVSLTLICISRALYSSSNSMLDAVTYSLLGSDRHQYGRQRLWGTLGTACIALLFTFLNDHVDVGEFSMQFASCASLSLLATITTIFFHRTTGNGPSLTPTSTTVRPRRYTHLRALFRHPAVKLFVVKLLVLGAFSGSAQNFIFWFLRELGSGQSVLGACLLANCLSTVVILRFSALIIRRLGETKTMYLALPAYCIRFVVVSVCEEPWMVVPLELLHGVTYSLLWASASASTHLLSSRSTLSSCQAIAGAVYWDFGRGLGSMITGQLFRAVGARWTFRGYGVMAVMLLPLFWFLDRHWLLPDHYTDNTDTEVKDTQLKDIEAFPLSACAHSREGETIGEMTASREDHSSKTSQSQSTQFIPLPQPVPICTK